MTLHTPPHPLDPFQTPTTQMNAAETPLSRLPRASQSRLPKSTKVKRSLIGHPTAYVNRSQLGSKVKGGQSASEHTPDCGVSTWEFLNRESGKEVDDSVAAAVQEFLLEQHGESSRGSDRCTGRKTPKSKDSLKLKGPSDSKIHKDLLCMLDEVTAKCEKLQLGLNEKDGERDLAIRKIELRRTAEKESLEAQLRSQQNAINEATFEKNQLAAELERLRSRTESSDESSRLQTESERAELRRLTYECKTSLEACSKATDALAVIHDTMAADGHDVLRLETRKFTMVESTSAEGASSHSSNEALVTLASNCECLRKSTDVLATRSETAKDLSVRAARRISVLQDEVQALSQKNTQLLTFLKKVSSNMTHAQEENRTLEQQLAEMRAQVNAASESNQERESLRSAVFLLGDNLRVGLKKKDTVIETLKSRLGATQKKLEAAESQIQNDIREIQKQRATETAMCATVDELQTSVKSLTSKNKDLVHSLEKMEKDYTKTLKRTERKHEAERNVIRSDLEEKVTELTKLNSVKDLLEEELRMMKKQNAKSAADAARQTEVYRAEIQRLSSVLKATSLDARETNLITDLVQAQDEPAHEERATVSVAERPGTPGDKLASLANDVESGDTPPSETAAEQDEQTSIAPRDGTENPLVNVDPPNRVAVPGSPRRLRRTKRRSVRNDARKVVPDPWTEV